MTDRPLTRLQQGHIVLFDGRKHRIVKVNDCRALAVPCEKKVIRITTFTGKTIEFRRAEKAFSISPDSECEIVGKEE